MRSSSDLAVNIHRLICMVSIRKILVIALSIVVFAGCTEKDFIWYEEAQQDDGSIIVVKSVETRGSQSRIAPGSGMQGYRFVQIEFDDPVTKRHLIWKPVGIPRIQPLALHFHDGQPYVFGVPYLETDFIEFGCPNPSYIIYTYKGGRWKRIKHSDLPVKFERVNLLTDSGSPIVENKLTQYVKDGGLLNAGSIDNSGSREFYHRIIDDMKSPYAICSYGYNLTTTFDSVEFN